MKQKGTQQRCYESILEEVRKMIIRGELHAGDRFPTERELAERFHVSRVPVRESIKILEYIGVLEIRTDGSYVCNVSVQDIISKMNFAYTATNQAISDLMELRCELESIGASFAAQRRTSEDIEAMEETLRRMNPLERNFENLTEQERENLRSLSHHFHELVICATKNGVLIQMYQGLYDLLDISMQYTSVSNNSTKAYRQILFHIINHDSEAASARMREHIVAAKKKLVQQMLADTVSEEPTETERLDQDRQKAPEADNGFLP